MKDHHDLICLRIRTCCLLLKKEKERKTIDMNTLNMRE